MKRAASPSWLSRLPANVTIEAVTGHDPMLVLIQGENRVRVGLQDVKALTDAVAESVPAQVGSGVQDEVVAHGLYVSSGNAQG